MRENPPFKTVRGSSPLCLTSHLEVFVIKNVIAELRKEMELTQQELAARLGVSRQTIISLENGKYNPSIILAFKIAQVFDRAIEEIFIYEEE